MPALENWNPLKLQCANCDDVIWSKFPGEYVQCNCGGIAVDQTRHYSRYIGDPKLFKEYKDGD